MKILDMHTHIQSESISPNPGAVIEKMAKAGIYGGVAMSKMPGVAPFKEDAPVLERAKNVLSWCEGYEDRLFPVLFIHPDEENVIEDVKKASEMGIVGFKMICNDYYVYDTKSMDLISAIAKLGKPVIFHSGILWDGRISSNYNKPVNWEALLDISGVKFSMGHCSWPWHDECIALYGKFLNSYTMNPDTSAEMFFDITPGTPEIYREDLLTKLFGTGYDVPHNIMYGTDCIVENYNHVWAKKWLDIDGKIMDKIGVPESVREMMYYHNFMRFIGREEKDFTHISPTIDGQNSWSLDIYR